VRDLGEKEEPDRWVPVVSERERDRGTGSVFNPGWAEAEMLAGPDWFPEALF
jgi:hypothetical protein